MNININIDNICDKLKALWKKEEGSVVKKTVVDKNVLLVSYFFVILFLILIGYIAKYIIFDSSDIIVNSHNTRQDIMASKVIRGSIVSADGETLAKSEVDNSGNVTRIYPYGNIFAHVVGYSAKGKSGIESSENFRLLTSNANIFEQIKNTLFNDKNIGDTVVTTLSYKLQKVAYDALGDRKGAIVVLEPSTGKILTMVSKPDFDPNEITNIWNDIINDSNSSVLLNRVTNGLYPPGSTFKVLTALEYIRENDDYEQYLYDCVGNDIINGVSISCYGDTSHGKVDLVSSIAKSCNTSFANIGNSLNLDSFYNLCEDFLYNKQFEFNFACKSSKYLLTSKNDDGDIAQTVIGQGKTQITPLHNALIFSAIANGGVLMEPYLVDRIENYTGSLVKKNSSKLYKKIINSDEAKTITNLLENVVNNGTAKALSGKSYTVAGKTGSAEFADGEPAHAWFVGFAPVDNPEIVVSVLIENVGAGSTYAVPVAEKILDAYFN